jgi:hypothetical protein
MSILQLIEVGQSGSTMFHLPIDLTRPIPRPIPWPIADHDRNFLQVFFSWLNYFLLAAQLDLVAISSLVFAVGSLAPIWPGELGLRCCA